MKNVTQCEMHQTRKIKIERKLMCLTCKVIIPKSEGINHQHTGKLLIVIINHYFCPNCRNESTQCKIYM